MSATARPPEGGALPPSGVEQGFRGAPLRTCGTGRLCKAGPAARSGRRVVEYLPRLAHALLLLALAAWLGAARAAEPIPVLVLHSYSQEYPWTLGQHRGFMEGLGADPSRRYDVRVEYLDTKRVAYTPAYAALIAEHLAEKYRGYRPRAIYATDDNALAFALAHLQRQFAGVPVFFSGINDYAIRSRLDPAQVTGVFEKKEIAPNLALMRAIAPDMRDIVVVGDESETYRAIEREILAELRGQPGISASFVASGRIDELTGRLREQKGRFVFLTTLGRVTDRDGRTLTLPETIDAIVATGDLVVFSMEDAYLQPGVLGGYVTSGPRQGRAAAGLLRRHLDGAPVASLAPIEASPNEYVVDEQQLKRTGLSLPPEIEDRTTHVNVMPTFYQANRSVVLGTLYALAALTLLGLAAALHVSSRKNRQIAAAMARLEQAQDGLDRAQRIAQMGNWDWRITENRIFWSDGIYRVFGVEPSSFGASYEAFLEFVHPDDREAVDLEVSNALQARAPYNVEHRIVRPDGTIRVVHESAEILRDADGVAVRMVGTVQDITENKAAEQALLHSEARANLIIENAPDAMLVVDGSGRIQRMNGRAESVFGYARTELVGQLIELLLPEHMRSSHRHTRDGYLGEPTPRSMGKNREVFARRKDGSQIPIEISLAPIHQGAEVQVIVSIVDTSERRAMEAELRAHRDRLEDLVAERTAELVAARAEAERLAHTKSEFLANMSHEIRTPLNAVLGMARIGARDSAGRVTKETFGRILEAGEHLLGVINDILDLSKMEAGKLTVAREPFRLAAVIGNARSFVAGPARQKGLECTVTLAPDLTDWVRGDAQRVQQILVNLLANAVKFTERGEVRLRVARDADTTWFRVIDTGIGMTTEQAERIFAPFEQADSSTTRRYGGTGLGLSISQRLANLMGGEITVDSAPGAGSSFTLCVPLPACEAPALDPTQTGPSGQRLVGLRVLAAEDVAVNRLILEDLLTHEGASVVFAEHGRELLERLHDAGAAAFDVVLMDVQMPHMDGYEATRRLCEIAPQLPVIGLTAHALAEERLRCFAAGMVEHVTKPIEADELVAAILRHARPAPAAPAWNNGSAAARAVDWEGLLARYDGRPSFVDKLAMAAQSSHSETPAHLRAAARDHDLAAVSFIAHNLKGVAANLLAYDVRDLADRTERAAIAADHTVWTLSADLAEALEGLLVELTDR